MDKQRYLISWGKYNKLEVKFTIYNIALSTTKVEFIALLEAVKEAKWLQRLLKYFNLVSHKTQ